MKVVPARVARLRPCATTARLGSEVAEIRALGAVLRLRRRPGTAVISFSCGPMKEAILRARASRSWRVRSGDGLAELLAFFMVLAFSGATTRYPLGWGTTSLFSHGERNRQ